MNQWFICQFKIAGFPGVIGCIDGSYIKVIKPANKHNHTVVNRHDHVSVTMQAICDSEKKIIDICAGKLALGLSAVFVYTGLNRFKRFV